MSTVFSSPAVMVDLSAYTGPWTFFQAAHLLRRASFSPIKSEIDEAVSLGLNGSINRLFASVPLPEEPVYYDGYVHPEATDGDSWTDLYLNADDVAGDNGARRRSLEAWWFLTTSAGGFSVKEKMAFFWHNHFGISNVNDYRAVYQMITTYRNFSTGNFRDLVKVMTINPLMLVFLNGNQSTGESPNENFAREILELFTIGKGPQVSPGDYTNYTEQDVTELAKAFTGWRTRNFNTRTDGLALESYFTASRHDTTTKQLSYRFGNAEIPNADELEYSNVVDLIFQQDEVARYICRKLYRHFVYYEITQDIEDNIIVPMAQIMVDNDYEISEALQALLKSQHFYDMSIAGDMIKTPLEFTHSIFRPSHFYNQDNLRDRYEAGREAHLHARVTGMELRLPPSVAGWEAYYQEPSFYRIWLNTSTIQSRTTFQRNSTLRWHFWNGERHYIDWLTLLAEFSNPVNPNDMIEEMGLRLLPRPLETIQLTALKELLLPGLEDFVWSDEYSIFLANPGDEAGRESVSNRLNEMMYGLLQLAEFQLN